MKKRFPELPVEVSATCATLGFCFGFYYIAVRDWKWATYWGIFFLVNSIVVYLKWWRHRDTDDIF